jgi:CubicO group peptidase (beta-lactamase class C family)
VLSFSRGQPIHSRRFGVLIGALIGIAVFEQRSSAQSLTVRLFETTLESLRVEAGIPAVSGAILENGAVVWARGLGKQDLEGNIAARPDTPYVVGSLAQTMGSTLLLRKCIDQSYAEITDLVVRWAPAYPEPTTRINELLSHTAPDGIFRYDPSRFSALTGVAEECGRKRYPRLLVDEILDRLAMINSVPGQTLATPTTEDTAMFEPARLARYADILRSLAVPYRVVSRRATRNTEVVPAKANAARGIVASALDLANFDLALDRGLLLDAGTRVQAMSQAFANGRPLPTGLGWFVQAYKGEPIVWQFGTIDGAYSSLIVKVPNRRLTLILLANSDGLTAPFALAAGDVTASIFAKTFLLAFLP